MPRASLAKGDVGAGVRRGDTMRPASSHPHDPILARRGLLVSRVAAEFRPAPRFTVQRLTNGRYLVSIQQPGTPLSMWPVIDRATFDKRGRGPMAHPIPAGHHAITPHLVIDGASEA